ncbi:conjugal transfer protein, partial [Providencia rettgeri]|nr:conjugal transfer protein [Providencia rettgeri]
MERKTLTLKRPTIEKESESTEPVIQRRRKQVVVNT